jgi:hypothetical protein
MSRFKNILNTTEQTITSDIAEPDIKIGDISKRKVDTDICPITGKKKKKKNKKLRKALNKNNIFYTHLERKPN